MFKFQSALQPWNGQHLSIVEMQKALSDLRLQHLDEIAPEMGVRELLSLAVEQQWIVEQGNGSLMVCLPELATV